MSKPIENLLSFHSRFRYTFVLFEMISFCRVRERDISSRLRHFRLTRFRVTLRSKMCPRFFSSSSSRCDLSLLVVAQYTLYALIILLYISHLFSYFCVCVFAHVSLFHSDDVKSMFTVVATKKLKNKGQRTNSLLCSLLMIGSIVIVT